MRKVKSNKIKNKIKVHGKVGVAYTVTRFCRKDFHYTCGYLVEEGNCLRSGTSIIFLQQFHNEFQVVSFY